MDNLILTNLQSDSTEEEGGEYFSDLRLGEKSLADCDMVFQIRDCRLYFNKIDAHCSMAMCVLFESSTGNNRWESDDLIVQQLFCTTAYSDGVRHLKFNRNGGDNCGYIYYPDLPALIAMLAKVNDIQPDFDGFNVPTIEESLNRLRNH